MQTFLRSSQVAYSLPVIVRNSLLKVGPAKMKGPRIPIRGPLFARARELSPSGELADLLELLERLAGGGIHALERLPADLARQLEELLRLRAGGGELLLEVVGLQASNLGDGLGAGDRLGSVERGLRIDGRGVDELLAEGLRTGLGGEHDLFNSLYAVLSGSIDLGVRVTGLGDALFGKGLDVLGNARFLRGGQHVLCLAGEFVHSCLHSGLRPPCVERTAL